MTDLQLIASPVKKINARVELLSVDPEDPHKKQEIQWREYQDRNWGELEPYKWKQISERDAQGIFPSISETVECDIIKMNLKIDANSAIRRVGTVTLHMKDDSYIEREFEQAWFNKVIRLIVIFYDWQQKREKEFNLGCYLITNGEYTFDADHEELELTLSDMMATVTQEYGSTIGAKMEVDVAQGLTIQKVLEDFVRQFFVYTYNEICDFGGQLLPYNLQFNHGIYPFEVAEKVVNLFPTYQQFYSVDGVYIVQQIPTGTSEEPVLTADDIDKLIITDSGTITPKDIKNISQVWGYELDKDYADYTAKSCTTVGENLYQLDVDEDMVVYDEGMTIAFTTSSESVSGQMIDIQGIGAALIVVINSIGYIRPVNKGELENDVQYVVKYANGYFELIGPSEIHAMAALFNQRPSAETINKMKLKYGCNYIRVVVDNTSRFSIEKIGERVQTFSGGEYDNIYTTQLALQRAYFENWKTSKLADSITLKMLYVPWLDVNKKVEYRSIITGKTNMYMVNQITVDWETFTMDVKLTRYYPYYPQSKDKYKWMDWEDTNWGDHSNKLWQDIAYKND